MKRYRLFGREDVVLFVRTTDKKEPDWWVIGGSTPMNLYSTRMFPEADIAYSLHHGLMLRIADRNYDESKVAPDEIGYDAFISHASEDKQKFVKPLAKALSRMEYRVWYDEFELRVGDSLRQSIDKGLVNSNFGIVVLSPAFFAKLAPIRTERPDGPRVGWPQGHSTDLARGGSRGRACLQPDASRQSRAFKPTAEYTGKDRRSVSRSS